MKVKSVSLTAPDANSTAYAENPSQSLSVVIELDDKSIKTLTILESHAGFKNALESIPKFQRHEITEDELAKILLSASDRTEHVTKKFEDLGALDGRLVRKGNRILIDYEPIDPVLEDHIIRILDEGDKDNEWKALVAFINNLYSNTLDYVREQLFGWLNACSQGSEKGFTITSDGCFIGYKGCANRDGHPVSINSGFGIVNGEETTGRLDNSVGNIVEMPRNMVENDPNTACSTGLHVGTWDYASGFSQGYILTVKVNPRDVVSIPNDYNYQKLRCCRYEVLDITEKPHVQTTWSVSDYGFDTGCEDDYGIDYYTDGCDCGDCEVCSY